MKKLLVIILLLCHYGFAQIQNNRIEVIKNKLTALSVDNAGLSEQAKAQINVSNITLGNFLMAISENHKLNISVHQDLNQININNNFPDATVADLLLFLCKEYDLTIDFTGNILSVKRYIIPEGVPLERVIPVSYSPKENIVSIDAKGDKLYDVFKRVMDESAKNLVFSPGLEDKVITFYVKDSPFDSAMDKLALANNLYVEKTKDNFYLFEGNNTEDAQNLSLNNRKRLGESTFFKVLDMENQLLEVDFDNTPIANVINDIGDALGIDIFTATPLSSAGSVTFKAKSIVFDDLLAKMFESKSESSEANTPENALNQPNNGRNNNIQNGNLIASNSNGLFTFKKEGNIYYFGTETQLSVRKVEVIRLMHRSVELLADPVGGNSRGSNFGYRSNGYGNSYNNYNSYNNFSSQNRNINNQFDNSVGSTGRNRQQLSTYNSSPSFGTQTNSNAQALVDILPDEVKKGLDIKMDFELNSFYVNGPSANVERFKAFVKKIDQPVPVVLIELMIIEVSKSATVETGVSWGIGENEVNTRGNIFPDTDLTLGSKTINKVIGGFDGIGSFNLGKVVPEFFANIKALETNGNIKIRSTPKISTLNGHKATLSNGETSYYAVTQRNIYGTDNPQTSEITNYQPIDAELGLTIKPLVSGDGQVTLDIFVIQSSFGNRIANDAPPDLNSREFTSIIRVKDQDIVVLGGLEEHVKKDNGSGVPLLARIPVIKWLFSARKREDKKAKLTILIKPTVIY